MFVGVFVKDVVGVGVTPNCDEVLTPKVSVVIPVYVEDTAEKILELFKTE